MIDLELALQGLHRAGVEFIIVGGVAATIHGSARLTQDLDVVYGARPKTLPGSRERSLRTSRIFAERRLGCPFGGPPRRSGVASTSP